MRRYAPIRLHEAVADSWGNCHLTAPKRKIMAEIFLHICNNSVPLWVLSSVCRKSPVGAGLLLIDNISRPVFSMCPTPVCGSLCGQKQSLAGAIPAGLCRIHSIPPFHSMNNMKTAPGPPHEVGCHNQRKQPARREIFWEERSWRKGECGVKRTPPYHTITLKLLRRANTVKNRSSKN